VRGRLRVYLGCAPGVGKTYAMLDEGHRRAERGTDVVVALVETHNREHTAAKVEGLDLIPRKVLQHRGSEFSELDLAAVLERHPQVALVDELAHTNVPGAGNAKRWQDVEAMLAAGIDVVTTVNVQHLESLNDVVVSITGVPQRETVPDTVVRAADQVELVDMSPESLRRRMAHGNVYAPEKVDAALGNYFRVGNLTALRELALVWLAGSVEESLQRYRAEHGIAGTWDTRERIVVALTGGPEGETLLRRAARIAARGSGADLLALHVSRSDGLSDEGVAGLAAQRELVAALGGTYHSVVGEDPPTAILEFARSVDATQVVLGASRRGALATALTGPGNVATTTRLSGPIDVHVVSHDYVGRGRRLPGLTGGLTPRRRLLGLILAVVAFAGLTPLTTALRSQLSLASDLLLFLLATVAVSLVGGFYPALAAAIVGSLLVNYYLVPPFHTLTISAPENVLALVVFVLIAAAVSRVVDLAARRSVLAARRSAEAEALSTLAGSVLGGGDALTALLDRTRETFAMTGVALLRRTAEGWVTVAVLGPADIATPRDADADIAIGDDLVLALRGHALRAEDQRLLAAFAAQAVVAYRQRQLAQVAAAAEPIASSARLRTALLNALSHDLRTPLASAKAAVSSLRDPDIDWSPDAAAELLTGADDALDRLTALVTDLLDLSRLEADALPVLRKEIGLDDVVSRALDHVARGVRVDLDVPDTLPLVVTDPGLLERVVANLVQNALRYAPPTHPVRLAASEHGGVLELRVIDRGPGIASADRERAFTAFHRQGDVTGHDGAGVGLGLAIARGFTEAMGGELQLEDTPGGGLTAVVALPLPVAAGPP
jgi:two-component system sensor histidine kinase KdpD